MNNNIPTEETKKMRLPSAIINFIWEIRDYSRGRDTHSWEKGLIDLTLILVLIKIHNPNSRFFHSLPKKEHRTLEKFHENILKDFIKKEFVAPNKTNFGGFEYVVSCWRELATMKTSITDDRLLLKAHASQKQPLDNIKSPENKAALLILIINAFKNHIKEESPQSIVSSLSLLYTIHPRQGERDGVLEFQEQLATGTVVDLIVAKKKKIDLCIDPSANDIISINPNFSLHLLIKPEGISTGHAYLYNRELIVAKATGQKISSIEFFNNEYKNTMPEWQGKIKAYNTENTPHLFDVISFGLGHKLDVLGKQPPFYTARQRHSKGYASTLISDNLRHFSKLLKKEGKILLTVPNDIFNREKRWLKAPLIQNKNVSITAVVNLKQTKLFVFEKGQGKKVSVFNGKELLESKNVSEQSNTDSKNKSVKSNFASFIEEYKNKKGKFWKIISREDWTGWVKSSRNILWFFAPKVDGVPLGELVDPIKAERRKPKNSDIIINVSSLGSIPGNLNIQDRKSVKRPKTQACKMIDKTCLLVSTIGNKLKPTMFNYTGTPIYLTPGVIALTAKDKKTSYEFLMYSLSSEETRTQLGFLSSGNVIQRIKEDGLLSIKINKPKNKASEDAK